MSYEGIIDRDERGYLIRIPPEIIESLRWKEGEHVKLDISEWRGKVVIVVYKS